MAIQLQPAVPVFRIFDLLDPFGNRLRINQRPG
jgi:hypothetical protein